MRTTPLSTTRRIGYTVRCGVFSEQSERAGQKAVDVFKDYGWDRGHEYLVLKLRFKEGQSGRARRCISAVSLKKVPFSCAIRLEAHILWAVNLTRSKLQKDVQPFFQTLAYFVREYLCRRCKRYI